MNRRGFLKGFLGLVAAATLPLGAAVAQVRRTLDELRRDVIVTDYGVKLVKGPEDEDGMCEVYRARVVGMQLENGGELYESWAYLDEDIQEVVREKYPDRTIDQEVCLHCDALIEAAAGLRPW